MPMPWVFAPMFMPWVPAVVPMFMPMPWAPACWPWRWLVSAPAVPAISAETAAVAISVVKVFMILSIGWFG